MENPKVIEGEAVKTDTPKELAIRPENAQPALIIGENSVEVATRIANSLKDVVERQKLYSMIQDKKYVKVEGWNTLGALMGVFPEVVSVEKLPAKKVKLIQARVTQYNKQYTKLIVPAFFDPGNASTVKLQEIEFDEIAYKAVVRLKTAKGEQISQAEAFCSNLEESKMKNDEYAINSMAQTRATGKAFRIAFSWIMAMAGYEATPAEEMPADGFENNTPAPAAKPVAYPKKPTPAQVDEEVRYEPVTEATPVEPKADKPWKKWENPNKPNDPIAPINKQWECHGCGAMIPNVVKEYSEKFYGKPFCRDCQKVIPKIK